MLYVYASILREEITISSAVKNAFTRKYSSIFSFQYPGIFLCRTTCAGNCDQFVNKCVLCGIGMRLASDKSDKSVTSKGQTDDTEVSLSGSECNSHMKPYTPRQFTHFGSFYLRMGAV